MPLCKYLIYLSLYSRVNGWVACLGPADAGKKLSKTCKSFIYKQFITCDVRLKTDIGVRIMRLSIRRPIHIVHGL